MVVKKKIKSLNHIKLYKCQIFKITALKIFNWLYLSFSYGNNLSHVDIRKFLRYNLILELFFSEIKIKSSFFNYIDMCVCACECVCN